MGKTRSSRDMLSDVALAQQYICPQTAVFLSTQVALHQSLSEPDAVQTLPRGMLLQPDLPNR